jgi:nitrite reductase/ring-hydroxylating ferredoxin subunit
VLQGACLGCAGLALAACGGGSTGGSRGDSSGAVSPGGSDAGSSAAAPSQSAATGAGGAKPLAVLADMKIGSAIAAKTAGGKNLLMTRTSATEVVAFDATCTHQGCTVAPDGSKLACPCHGSIYDARTAKVLQGPAPAPLSSVAVKVTNGNVVLA